LEAICRLNPVEDVGTNEAHVIEILRSWEGAAAHYRERYNSNGKGRFQFKDYAFRAVYGELIRETIKLVPDSHNVLKTDLWNEGIEDGRSLAEYAQEGGEGSSLVCVDISRYVCESANRLKNSGFEPIQGTLLAPPIRTGFDLILDVSTVDHMPKNLRKIWISSEASLLKPGGILLISFDCRLNMFDELYHRHFTRKKYPEWTLVPSEIHAQLKAYGLSVVRQHSIFIAGFFWGTHRPFFPLAGLLKRRQVFKLLRDTELSNRSRWLPFLAPQYVIVARKNTGL
jgi:SAM-dependent methyltransferase